MKKKQYDSIDLSKLFASIIIVLMHADLFYDIYNVCPLPYVFFCGGIGRLGVPFFFISTAYFYFRKPLTRNGIRNYCKRLLILYAAWFVVYIPKTIFERFIMSKDPIGKTVFLFIRSFFVTSTFSGSWFITSCIFCALLYYLISKLNKNAARIITVVLSVVSYVWFTFTCEFFNCLNSFGISGFYEKYVFFFSSPYTSILVGIPYFAVGKYFADISKGERKIKYSRNLSIVLSFTTFTLLMIEVYICYSKKLNLYTDCYFMLLPCVSCIFPLILNWNIKLKNANRLRAYSTIIYFSQFIYLFLIEVAIKAVDISIPYYEKALFTLIMVLITSWTIMKLKDKKGFRWLGYLY